MKTESSSANETGHVVSKYSLEALVNRIADLEFRLAESQRQNELLRVVAEAARDHLVVIEGEFVNAVPVDTIEFRNNLRGSLWTAIDGGAIEIK